MEIYALSGYKVKVTEETKLNGYDFDKEKVKEHLKIDVIYTVDYTNVHQSSTTVYLKEIPNISFNSVNFEGVTEQPKELNENHDDWNKYQF